MPTTFARGAPRAVDELAFLCSLVAQRQIPGCASAGSKSCSSIAESNAADVVRSWCMFVKYLRMVLLHARTLSSELVVL